MRASVVSSSRLTLTTDSTLALSTGPPLLNLPVCSLCCTLDHFLNLSGVLGTGLPGLGTEHLPGALCSGTGSPALGLCSP